jgi:uncharacterized protein YndB with AHSA1/START domain
MPAKSAGSSKEPPFGVKGELVLTRSFDRPRRLVFEAWTNPKHLAQWWGPRGFTTTIREMDVRPGGTWSYVMRAPDGNDYAFDGAYVEVVEPERLVFDGSIHGSPEQRVWTEVTFTEGEGKTAIRVRQLYSFESEATRGAAIGWSQQLDRFGEFLAVMAPAG